MEIKIGNITPRQKLIIAKGLCDYKYIMDNWQVNDRDFQEVFYDFYLKARWAVMTKPNNRKPYFDMLQETNPDKNIMEVLEEFKQKTEKKSYEFSLVTKMLHTRDDSLPIYDSKVRDYLSKEEQVKLWWQIPNSVSGAPRGETEKAKIEHDWNALRDWYDGFLKSQRGEGWIEWFDYNFPAYTNISNLKKVDFVIFATN